jgi:hypothetical protein
LAKRDSEPPLKEAEEESDKVEESEEDEFDDLYVTYKPEATAKGSQKAYGKEET